MVTALRPPVDSAAHAFRTFFGELRSLFLEREALFTQLELALLCREHLLIVGPPGTAKSAVASTVLGRIVDEKTGKPSLFSKQLSESTVQTDLIGPVDFKVLTETGRTEYLTDDGMLGATHAFLDEVFDGRDMLLRSILNVLHERELKHGRRVTAGSIECAIMTSNRYLSEVLARSPEVLLAFADRLSFICFVPKSFARPSSRGVMLARATASQRPVLEEKLTIQQLDLLQAQVESVQVPSTVAEALETLADALERELLAQVSRLPDYVPTKYFSQRSMVKALWALKASVVRDRIYRRPDRPLVAELEDLEQLRYFFLLGGPPPDEVEEMLKVAVDPRERAQLEIIRVEHSAFDQVLHKLPRDFGAGVTREGAQLSVKEDVAAAEALSKAWKDDAALNTLASLEHKLVPGPRHPENRVPLVSAARVAVGAVERKLSRGVAGSVDADAIARLCDAVRRALELCRATPELAELLPALATRAADFVRASLSQVALFVEGSELEGKPSLDGAAELLVQLRAAIDRLGALGTSLSAYAPATSTGILELETAVRTRAARAIRRRVTVGFSSRPAGGQDLFQALSADSKRLLDIERALLSVSSEGQGLREELLGPLGAQLASDAFAGARFERLEGLARTAQTVLEALRREGIPPSVAAKASREVLEERIAAYAQAAESPDVRPSANAAISGDAYAQYTSGPLAKWRDGDLAALCQLDAMLKDGNASFFGPALFLSVAGAEVSLLEVRVRYLREWLSLLLKTLPAASALSKPRDAELALDRLVTSRFPQLALKEGELARLTGLLKPLAARGGAAGERASAALASLDECAKALEAFSQRVLAARTAQKS